MLGQLHVAMYKYHNNYDALHCCAVTPPCSVAINNVYCVPPPTVVVLWWYYGIHVTFSDASSCVSKCVQSQTFSLHNYAASGY